MRSILRANYWCLALLIAFSINYSSAQLLYEGMVFDGMGKPLLENASSVSISPDGKFVYATSFNDNAVTVYSRDISGSMGELTFVETKKNEVDNTVGINGAYHLEISPDGNHVYVAGSLDDAVTVFSRNAVNGTLTYITTYWNNVEGIEGIAGAYYIDIPPDGNHIYVAGPDENAVAVFKRNVLNGELTFIEMIQDESGDVTEMNYPLSVMSSPDGKHVYVTSFGDNALNVFQRNLVTGELTFVEYHKEGVSGVSGLMAAYAPYVTPDGEQVYVAGLDSDAIVAFNRNTSSGELTYIDTYVDNTNGVDGISGPTAIRVSDSGDHLFVSGSNEDAVSIFSRNADSGVITFITMVQEGVNGVSGMAYPTYLDISEDGNNLYVTGFASASLAIFDIDDQIGDLEFQSAETGFGLGVSGLDGSTAVAVSPDGNNVYVAGNNDDAIVVFDRDPNTGMLTYVHEIEDGSTTDGLNGINCIAISSDGNYVYTTGFWDKTVVLFERNSTTGELTYVERYKDGISGVDGLNGANFVTISPDGQTVYATGYWEHAVAVFNRNTNDGTLSFVEVHKDGTLGVDGLNRASGVTVSPDGTSVYCAGYNDNAISIFERDTNDGTLTYTGIVKDGIGGVDGIQRVNSVVVSPDNQNVYATGQNDDAIAIFERDSGTGGLTFEAQAKNGVGDVVGLDGPTKLAISANGEHVYCTSTNDDAIVAFRRDGSTGGLIFEGAEFDSEPGINGLDGAQFVAVTPDGKHMYAASTVDNAVSIFSCTYILSMNETICEGDSVVVGSNVYLTSGTYIDTFSFGACKSVTTLELVVQPAMTVMDVEICDGDTYEFDGTVYEDSGSYTADFVSGHGCDSTVVLNLTVVNEFSATEIVASICEGENYGGYTESGSYTEVFTTSFGCDSTVHIDLTVNEVYNVTVDAEICEGDFYVLGTQNYIATGTYVEPFTSSTGCDSIITLNLFVVEPEMILNETICEGDVYNIGTFSFTEQGTYDFILESQAGCDSEVTLNLNVNPVFTVELIEEICEGDTYTIGSSVFDQTGVYTEVFQAVNGCDSTIVLDLTVHSTTTELEETICEGESITIGTSTYTTTGEYTNVFTSTSGCGDSTVYLNLVVEPATAELIAIVCDGETYTFNNNVYTQTGIYTEVVTTGSGCDTEYTIDLTVLNPIEAVDDVSFNPGTSTGYIDISVSGGLPPYTFNWSNGADTEDIVDVPVGTYTVEITDANGCTISYTYTLDQTDPVVDLGNDIGLMIYPNPAAAGGFLNLQFDVNNQQTVIIKLFDSVGKLVRSEAVDFISGQTTHRLKLPAVQGLYSLYIETEDGQYKTTQISVK